MRKLPNMICLAVLLWLPAIAIAQQTATDSKPVGFESVARISPENTKVEFVGTHVGDEPKPRLGGFSEFAGIIGVDTASEQVTSIQVAFQIGSIWTEFDDLTKHLMNEDFFEESDFPAARFVSTSVTTLQDGMCNVVGNLTLHGVTSEIRFPANYRFEDTGLVLTAQFFLDRTEFGMDQMTSGVENMVSLNVVVGEPTAPRASQAGHGGDSDDQASADEAMAERVLVSVALPHML